MEKKRAYSYTRVSTSMQIDGFSLAAQKARIDNYAKSQDIDIIREFSDEGKSGKSIEGREDFKSMLDYIKAGEHVDYIIVYKLSRFGRNIRDILDTFEFIREHKVNLICVEDGIDSSKSMGKVIITILGALSELERENIAVQTMEGRKEKARQGKWNGGQAPYGYKIVDGKLVVVEDEAEIIRMIYNLFINDNGMKKVADYLNDRGYRRKPYKNNSLKLFTSDFVKRVLDNEVYMGKISYGKRQRQKKKGTRNQYVTVKSDDYIVSEGIHKAIVSEDVWQKAHKKRKATGVANIKTHSLDHEHKLSGILKCPVCGDSMYGNVNRSRKKDGSEEYYDNFYYCCKHRKLAAGKKCNFRKQPSQQKIDYEVYSALMSADMGDVIIEELKAKMLEESNKEKMEKDLEGLKKTDRTLEVQINNINARIDGLDVDDAAYKLKYANFVKVQNKKYEDQARVKKAIEELEKKIKNEIIMSDSIMTEYRALNKYLDNWWNMSELEQKKFFRKYIERVELFEDYDRNKRGVKKIIFKFPLRFTVNDPLKGDIVPHKNAKLINWNGEMVPDRWEYVNDYVMADGLEWDKEGHVEAIALIQKM